MKNLRVSALFLALFMSLSLSYAADDKDAAKRQQQIQRKLTQEKTALEGQLRDATARADEINKKAEEANSKASALNGRVRRLESEKEKLTLAAAELSADLSKQKDASDKLSAEKSLLQAQLAKQVNTTKACDARNAKLHQYGEELLGLYERKGVFTGLLQSEPLTKLGRIEMENRIEDYRDKLDELKPEAGAASAVK